MNTPYQSLGPEKFWRTGVAEAQESSFYSNIWTPRFSIKKSDKILTAGSCFAQHISRWLIANGYNWLEAEVPPKNLSELEAEEMGFGVFSFRTGNIYTTALLRQWVEMAIGEGPEIIEFFKEEKRFFDPLRPLIPQNGYESSEELLRGRAKTLGAMKAVLAEANVFIFTLGLVEGWRNKTGYVYPLCPGTAKGEFDAVTTEFFNQSHGDIVSDLNVTFDKIHKLNPSVRFLLTVSPVPLTATADEGHVLVETVQAKSTLRSAANEVVNLRDDVDYFPSYELIASHATKSRYYARNLRSVLPEGVENVMRHFSCGLSGDWKALADQNRAQIKQEVPSSYDDPSKTDEDLLCEDVLYESWIGHNLSGDERVCLIGDSHMGHLSRSFRQLGIAHAGGMIMNGSAWNSNLLHLDEAEFFVPLENGSSRERWKETLSFFARDPDYPMQDLLVITNVGQQTHQSVSMYVNWILENGKKHSDDLFKKYFLEIHKKKLVLLKKIINIGCKVHVVSDPPLQFLNKELDVALWNMYENNSFDVYRNIGAKFFSVRNFFSDVELGPEYYSEKFLSGNKHDWLHGGERLYNEVAGALIDFYKLK